MPRNATIELKAHISSQIALSILIFQAFKGWDFEFWVTPLSKVGDMICQDMSPNIETSGK